MDNYFEKALKDFISFEFETSKIYPWAISPDNIMNHINEIYKECGGNEDTDDLYFAIDKVCGVNPALINT